jgi:uncharacterized membrane protein
MYLLDPAHGRRRRAMLQDKLARGWHRGLRDLCRAGRDLAHRLQGVVAEARSALTDRPVDDQVLSERVRSRVGRLRPHPQSVSTEVRDGIVIVTGAAAAPVAASLVRKIESVRGVRRVENRLDVSPGSAPDTARPDGRLELLRGHWSPGARLAIGAAGAGFALYALTHRDRGGLALGLAGLPLFTRAATNLSWRRLLGWGTSRRTIELYKTVTIRTPIEDAFAFFDRCEDFPKFMTHVREVRVGAAGRSHWVAVGPAGSSFEWDAEITRREPNRLLAWRSLPGAEVANAGTVRFEHTDGTTRLIVHLSYRPPAGALGNGLAALFGKHPKRALDDDLARLKSLLEHGRATGRTGPVSKEELGGPDVRPHRHEAS